MKITREEFKELVALHKEMNKKIDDVSNYINQDLACDLAFTLFDWIEKKLDIRDDGWDLLWDCKHGVVIDELDEDGNYVYSNDLDKIYDTYVAEPSKWREI